MLLLALLTLISIFAIVGLRRGWFERRPSSSTIAETALDAAMPPEDSEHRDPKKKTGSPVYPSYINAIFPPTD